MKSRYLISFLSGLEEPIEQLLKKCGGVSVERMLSGGALLRSSRTPVLPFARQRFLVLFQMKPCVLPDEALKRLLTAGEWLNALPYEEISGKRFRITVSDGEKKTPAGMRYISLLEKAIEEQTGMHVNRERPECEFWVLLRKEAAYFLLHIPSQGQETKGRLRPDVAGTVALLFGYNPGTVALLGATDDVLVRMLREQGAKKILCVRDNNGEDGFKSRKDGIRVVLGTPEQTGLEEKTCNGACLFLPARKGMTSFNLREALHESARILTREGTLVLVAPQQDAQSIAERNQEFQMNERYFCEWGGCRMMIVKMLRVKPEET